MTRAAGSWSAALLAALSLTLAACGSGDSGGGSGDQVTLTYWTMLPPEDDNPRSEAEQKIINQFMEENPDIDVKVEFFPWNELPQKTILAVQADGGPDVARVSFGQTLEYLSQDTLQPLDEYLDGVDEDEFLGESTVFDGKRMSLIWSPVPNGILYRKDLFEETGLPAPQTWSELTEVLKAMTTDEVAGFGFGMQKGDNLLTTFLGPYVWGEGSHAFDDDGTATFDNPAGVDALQYLVDLVKVHGVMPDNVVNVGANDAMEAFRAGKYAAVVESASRVTYAASSEVTEGNVGMWRFPSSDGDGSPSYVLSWSIGMTSSTEQPDAAWRFIEYLTSNDADVVKAEIAGELPSRASSLDRGLFEDDSISREFLQYVKDFPDSPQRYVADQTLYSDLVTEATQDVLLNDTPMQDALTGAAQKYDAAQ